MEKEKKKKKKKEEIKPLKPIFSIANIIYTGIIFGAVAITMVVLPRPEFSNIEQRKLATMPEFTYEDFMNGNYTAGIRFLNTKSTTVSRTTVTSFTKLRKLGIVCIILKASSIGFVSSATGTNV